MAELRQTGSSTSRKRTLTRFMSQICDKILYNLSHTGRTVGVIGSRQVGGEPFAAVKRHVMSAWGIGPKDSAETSTPHCGQSASRRPPESAFDAIAAIPTS